MTSVSPSLNNINHGSPSLTSSPSSRPGSARHLSPCAIWSNRYQGISKGYRSRTSSTTSGGIVRNLGFLLPEQILQSCDLSSASTYSSGYTASRKPSPQPHSHREHVESDSAVVWSMPTPPRSESGATSRSPATAGSYPLADATGSSDASSTRSSMSTLNYMGQPQYQQYSHDGQLYAAPSSYSYDQAYRIHAQAQHAPQSYDLSGMGASYHQTPSRTASQSSAYQSSDQTLNVHNPYGLGYAQPHSSTQRSMSSPMPTTSAGVAQPKYAEMYPSERSTSMLDPRYYGSSSTASQAVPTQASSTLAYAMLPQYSNPPQPQTFQRSDSMTSAGSSSARPTIQKEKPQCWEHGCNGREFSTFSNLLRHQREKSGTATKSYCPRCGAEFTRTTARNGHLAHDKCTRRRPSEDEQ